MMRKAEKKYGFEPEYAVAPGETLKEVLESLGMSQKELALRTLLTPQTINRIIMGTQPITHTTAIRLEMATGVVASLWNSLESQYRELLARMAEQERISEEKQWLEQLPVKEMQQRGLLPMPATDEELTRTALAFFGCSDVRSYQGLWTAPDVAARRSACFETDIGAAAAWIRSGEKMAHEMDCASFSKSGLRSLLPRIRSCTVGEIEKAIHEIQRLLATAGVAMVIAEPFRKVPWNGATRWIIPQKKVMVLLSLRGKAEDIFWFSLFHEIGHVLHDERTRLFINSGHDKDEVETRADAFAAQTLIPPKYDERLQNVTSEEQVLMLAQELDVCPGIVAGQYRFRTKQWRRFSKLIRRIDVTMLK